MSVELGLYSFGDVCSQFDQVSFFWTYQREFACLLRKHLRMWKRVDGDVWFPKLSQVFVEICSLQQMPNGWSRLNIYGEALECSLVYRPSVRIVGITQQTDVFLWMFWGHRGLSSPRSEVATAQGIGEWYGELSKWRCYYYAEFGYWGWDGPVSFLSVPPLCNFSKAGPLAGWSFDS